MRMKSDTVSQSVFFDLAKRPFGVFSEVMGRIFLAGLIAVLTFSAPAFANSKYAGIVVDAKTGKVLYGEDADQLRYRPR